MKKTRTAQSAFLNLCISLGLLVFFAGILVALFAPPVVGRSRPTETTPHRSTFPYTFNLDRQTTRAVHGTAAPSGAVQEAWVARYNGPGNGDDEANAIAVDRASNVYVTGYSWGSGSGRDYTTIKYDSVGQQQWVSTYNGPANDDDMAAAITVDGAANVYVTGASLNSDGDLDYATIKYNSAGQQQWVARYNGAGGQFHVDSAVGIAVDSSGNVYVTGTSEGAGTGFDYATIKYDSAGQEQWVARYNGIASALALDGSGNVYVIGSSTGIGTSLDYATVKYNSAGQQQWVATYNGSGNGNDIASAIALDASGNVYTTGVNSESRYATVKYDSAGQQQWVATYPATSAAAVAVNASGNVYVTGYSTSCTNYDYTTIKYNSAGQDQWVARYNGPGNDDDRATAIAVDSSGNVYVTGQSLDSNALYFEYATVKYNEAGQEQWVARYNGPGTGENYARAIAVEASSNVYVTGFSAGSGTDFDYATIKYAQTAGVVEAKDTQGPTPTPTPTTSPTPTPISCQVFENFDAVNPPRLPNGWTASNGINSDGILWQTSNSGLPSPPADSPPNSAWVNDPDATSDKYLDSPPIRIDELENAILTFRSNYALEDGRDGGVLEISLDGGPFDDILSGGGSFLQGGYNGSISTDFCSPIAGRDAWTGNSGGFITTSVALPAGHVIMLRWRMGSDSSGVPGEGWRIDSIEIFCERPTPTATATATSTPTATSTATPTGTATPTTSATPTSTATATATPTTTPRITPTPRAAPTPRLRPTVPPRP